MRASLKALALSWALVAGCDVQTRMRPHTPSTDGAGSDLTPTDGPVRIVADSGGASPVRDAGTPPVADAQPADQLARDGSPVNPPDAAPPDQMALPPAAPLGSVRARRVSFSGAATQFARASGSVWQTTRGGLVVADALADKLYVFKPPAQLDLLAMNVGLPGPVTVDRTNALSYVKRGTQDPMNTSLIGEIMQEGRAGAGGFRNVAVHLRYGSATVPVSTGALILCDAGPTVSECYKVSPGSSNYKARITKGPAPWAAVTSPDERTLYVAYAGNKRVMKYSVDPMVMGNVLKDGACLTLCPPAVGGVGNEALFLDLTTAKDMNGVALDMPRANDLAVDDAGSVYVAGGPNVHVFRPDGQPVGIIAVGEPITSVAFGEADRKTLFITSETALFQAAVTTPGLVR